MRTLLAALVALPLALCGQSPAPASTGTINWVSLEKAQELSKKDGKPIFIDVYTEWCGPCKMLTAKTFTDLQTAAYINKHYHAVKFNAEGKDAVAYNGKKFENPDYNPAMASSRNGTHQLTLAIANVNGRIAYPTLVWMDKEGQVLAPVQGYMTPEQLEPILVYFAEGAYKDTQWEAFSGTFKTRRVATP
ncbi:MAG: thioredoxin fold domain-containing protein [Flavobacteriales bacterium]|nr:thioredoxin fold domain-containing protein [Flavobacteriales bacterium]